MQKLNPTPANSRGHAGLRLAVLALIVGAAMLFGARAQAQSYVRPDCRPLVTTDRLDPSPLSARWYRRFWTGDCAGLHGCLNGSPNWNEIVGKLVARSHPGERAAVLADACRLGPLIGEEWTRPRKVRRIDSRDLQNFKSVLESSDDVRTGIRRVKAQAQAKVSAGRR